MWLENLGFAGPGEGWKMVEDGDTQIAGDLPVNMSGGVLSSNPIGASGMRRFAEAALQVRGLAGAHQVAGARTDVGHDSGGGWQLLDRQRVVSGKSVSVRVDIGGPGNIKRKKEKHN